MKILIERRLGRLRFQLVTLLLCLLPVAAAAQFDAQYYIDYSRSSLELLQMQRVMQMNVDRMNQNAHAGAAMAAAQQQAKPREARPSTRMRIPNR